MSKLRRDLRVALAGACCGLFGVSVFLLAERVDTYYAYLRWMEEIHYDVRYEARVEDLSWIPIALWHVVLSITAALLVHRYQSSDRVSPFLRWQAIGFSALFGWALTFLTALGAETLVRGSLPPAGQTWSWTKLIAVAQFIAAVFASNVLFGSAVQAASSEAIREDNPVRESGL
jgi:hypothetical protein